MIDKKQQVKEKIKKLEKDGRLGDTRKFVQHGRKSVFDHVLRVTVTSLEIAERLNITVDEDSLIRGALLHDYFLYDWHEKDKSHSWHGFRHPKTSLRNAMEDFDLNEIEIDIISHHMFPLTVVPAMSFTKVTLLALG